MHKKNNKPHPAPPRTPLRRRAACAGLAALTLHAGAEPLPLATAPAGSGYRLPAPNVIVTLDDSGSMRGPGMVELKEALRTAFSPQNMPDGAIRLGWNAMNRCRDIPSGEAGCNGANHLRVFDAAQRARFLGWVDSDGLRADGATPTHQAYIAAGDYFANASATDVNGPWAHTPGQRLQPVFSCRKSYSLLMTDGGWNHEVTGPAVTRGGLNTDGTPRRLPDGQNYAVGEPYARVYRDAWGGNTATGTISTMADLAMHYWSTDLAPALANDGVPRVAAAAPEVVTSPSGATVTLPAYWNPKNDPATWQHLTTYTVGFRDAAGWPTTREFADLPVWDGSSFGGSYADLVTGGKGWPDPIGASPIFSERFDRVRRTEMWHMALNGRGKFIPARSANDLVGAFQDILGEIVHDTSVASTSVAGSSHSLRLASAAFTAGYQADGWWGQVHRREIAAGTGQLQPGTSRWGTVQPPAEINALPGEAPPAPVPRSTADIMDAQGADWPANRVVMSYRSGSGTVPAQGIHLRWDDLSEAQQNALRATPGGALESVELAQQRLAFLRGDRSQENSAAFRSRKSRHGDIVHSQIWFTPGRPSGNYVANDYAAFRTGMLNARRPDMLYVGANDGYLHAFDADTGEERLAYLPEGLVGPAAALSRPGYRHRYYVDGSPFTADLYTGNAWRTYLAGTLGAGGKGYFVLDVTRPHQFASANPNNLVVLDTTAGTDRDIGHIAAQPVTERSDPVLTRQITQLNNGRWALVLGNGVNSTDEKAVLLIQYLDGQRELKKITATATAGTGNGLSAPRLVDVNGDRRADIALAGDQHGNLWKFDLTNADATRWNVAFNCQPLHTASVNGTAQPITSAPLYLPHPAGGMMVVYATGRNLTLPDRDDARVQSVYGIYDPTTVLMTGGPGGTLALGSNGTPVIGRTLLVAQTAGDAVGTVGEATIYQQSSNAVDYGGSTPRRGWYLDLPATRERVIDNLQWFDGDLIDIVSTVPATSAEAEETCSPTIQPATGFTTTINAVNGAAPKSQIYAYTAAGTQSPLTGSRVNASSPLRLRSGEREVSIGTGSSASPSRRLLSRMALRPSWRQLQ